jgi:type IV pilus assembly protein PilM
MKLFAKKAKPVLGLDISTSSVKVIEISAVGDTFRVESFAAEGMPPNAINDKVIVDVEAAGEAIKNAVKASGTGVRRAAVAVGGASVITKTIPMPAKLSDKELGEQIELQADQYIPFPLDDVAFDYEVVGASATDPEMVDVLLAATRKENVESRTQVLSAAGLQAKVVDIEAYALENACRLITHQLVDEGFGKTIAVIDFGAVTTTFSVLHDRKIVYTREQSFGGKALTEEIMRHYGLSFEEAGKAKKEGGLPNNYKNDILDPFVDDMAQQVNRSVQFFMSATSEYSHIDQLVLCGGCAMIPSALGMVQEKVGLPTVVADPFGRMKISTKAKGQMVENEAAGLMIACGLALRSFD